MINHTVAKQWIIKSLLWAVEKENVFILHDVKFFYFSRQKVIYCYTILLPQKGILCHL